MKSSDLLPLAILGIGGYYFMKKKTDNILSLPTIDTSIFQKALSASVDPFYSIRDIAVRAVETPGGILGKDSWTDPISPIVRGVETPGGVLGAQSWTDPGAFISNIQRGVETPGGVLGAQSWTDPGAFVANIYRGFSTEGGLLPKLW